MNKKEILSSLKGYDYDTEVKTDLRTNTKTDIINLRLHGSDKKADVYTLELSKTTLKITKTKEKNSFDEWVSMKTLFKDKNSKVSEYILDKVSSISVRDGKQNENLRLFINNREVK